MSVEANIVAREKQDAIVVPANAVIGNEVLVVKDGRPTPRKVEIGVRGAGHVEIVDGLEENEMVASPATANIQTRGHVKVRATDASSL
ncbi:hypothetical protein HAP48_0001870 (plasmid) [Bradyrhizobium septentrionale]|nr:MULTISPECIES: hypothetical protein [Bradyrhizobium]MCK7664683.1 hypothetical protein [Bradyrhizobium sp. 2S1]UGY11881.1 hypothetical protein HAP48_0001870 [Bradyrhizobium septentrionale]